MGYCIVFTRHLENKKMSQLRETQVPLKRKTPRNRYIDDIDFKLEILYHFPKIDIAQHYF